MAVAVQFWSTYTKKWTDKSYTYHCILDVKVDDLVVVDAKGEPKVARVAALDANIDDNLIVYKQVKCKLPNMLPNFAEETASDKELDLRQQINEFYSDDELAEVTNDT
jgi:hypothetical protein